MDGEKWDDATRCCHPSNSSAGLSQRKAIWQASAYEFDSLHHYHSASHFYRRYGFPNSDELASAVAALEGAEAGLATSSGMGAIVVAVLGVCESGDLAIVSSDAYGATLEFFRLDLPRFGVEVQFQDLQDPNQLDNAINQYPSTARERRIIMFVESISNPLVKVANLCALSSVCKKYGALLIVDNTMATPFRVKPLLEGADIVVHSATKYIGGHDDLMAGVVVASSQHIEKSSGLAARWGLTVSAFDAWLAIRSVHSLKVRLERAWASAAILADRIIASRLVLQVNTALKCAIICIEVFGDKDGADRAIRAFKLVKLSPSFGGTCTTVSHSATSSHKSLSPDERQRLGITDGILRISVGLEDVEDIWADLKTGLLATRTTSL